MSDYFEHRRDGTIGPKTKSILDVYDELLWWLPVTCDAEYNITLLSYDVDKTTKDGPPTIGSPEFR